MGPLAWAATVLLATALPNVPRWRIDGEVRVLVAACAGAARVHLLDDVAGELAMHPKTLQRRLLAEGQPFKDLVDEVRRNRFLELAAQPGTFNLTQLALLLGYSEQAALTRSCRRWFGCPPTELRRRATAGAGPVA